jgi:hypothetical protein
LSVPYRSNKTYDFAIIHSIIGKDKTTKKLILLPFLDNGTVLWMVDLLIFPSTFDYTANWHCYLYFWIHDLNAGCVMNTLQGQLLFIFCSEGTEGTHTHTHTHTHQHHHMVSHTRMETWSATNCCGCLKTLWKETSETLNSNMAIQKQYEE